MPQFSMSPKDMETILIALRIAVVQQQKTWVYALSIKDNTLAERLQKDYERTRDLLSALE